MGRKRLLFVISQFYKGGAEVSLLNLLCKLDFNQYEIDLLVMHQRPTNGTVDLIQHLPQYVNVCNAYKEEQNLSAMDKFSARVLFTKEELQKFPLKALLYVRERSYDWAFHIGEWWLPEFVALKVRASKKAIWIHTDISAANSFQAESFFQYDDCIDHYFFVSNNSLKRSLKEFPFLKKKSCCIYNISNVDSIRSKSKQYALKGTFRRPMVLTCANIREEKNHRRQIEAMRLLSLQGIKFTWVNIGSTADTALAEELLDTAKEYGLQDDFLLLGPKDNPYPYIANADIVAVLSDYESWSMVITEAKILGTPVIATKTSGAIEQIEDGRTGILTEFDAIDIANRLGNLLTSAQLRDEIRRNITNFDNTEEILDSFYSVLNVEAPRTSEGKILYIIDDINYSGGAHIATKSLIHELVLKNRDVTVFSGSVPSIKVRNELQGAEFIGWRQCAKNSLFYRRLCDCLRDPNLSRKEKALKFRMSWESKIRKSPMVFDKFVKDGLPILFSQYDIVCVMSESSVFRKEVAKSSANRKIQYIHTDYAAWRKLSKWTKDVTADDAAVYEKFDKIVLLSPEIQSRFVKIYPQLKSKAVVNQNILPSADIRKKAEPIPKKGALVKFVTVGRIDYYKGFDRLYEILEKLYYDGYQFYWTIIGDGEDFEKIKMKFAHSDFANRVIMKGSMTNPFREMKKADVFALFSRYEGIPNTIYEAMILGVPVIATNVGGIPSQIADGINGWLVNNDETDIYRGLIHIFNNPSEIEIYKNNLKNFQYDNAGVLEKTEQILFE